MTGDECVYSQCLFWVYIDNTQQITVEIKRGNGGDCNGQGMGGGREQHYDNTMTTLIYKEQSDKLLQCSCKNNFIKLVTSVKSYSITTVISNEGQHE